MNSTQKNNLRKVIAYTLAILTVLAFVVFIVMRQTSDFSFGPYNEPVVRARILNAFKNTIIVSVISLVGSMILGFIFYLFTISKIKYFNAFADIITEIVYGTPLLVLIIVSAFLIGPAFGSYNNILMGTIALIVYMAPYMTNVYKSAFSSISKEQYMAMDLFGFTPYQKYRYIIIPQVIRILMPTLMNNFSLIIKGSALLNVLTYSELYYIVTQAQYSSFAFVEGYILLWGLYLIITIPLSQLAKFVERKWSL